MSLKQKVSSLINNQLADESVLSRTRTRTREPKGSTASGSFDASFLSSLVQGLGPVRKSSSSKWNSSPVSNREEPGSGGRGLLASLDREVAPFIGWLHGVTGSPSPPCTWQSELKDWVHLETGTVLFLLGGLDWVWLVLVFEGPTSFLIGLEQLDCRKRKKVWSWLP